MTEKSLQKLLVVEDNADHVSLIQIKLNPWIEKTRCVVRYASCVTEALEHLSRDRFDMVLADYQLPDKTGLELFDEISKRNMDLPMLLMTSVGNDQLAENAVKKGFLEYLSKGGQEFQNLTAVLDNTYRRYLRNEELKGSQDKAGKENERLTAFGERLPELSIRDELTGLYNHRLFQEKIAEEFARAMRYQYPLTCLLIDLDDFKMINEAHGYPAGDVILMELAKVLKRSARQSDTVARYGGEEFSILVPHTGYEGGLRFAERLRKEVLGRQFETAAGTLTATVSIGIAAYPEDPLPHKGMFLQFADQALRRAKANGRNRCFLYRDIAREFSGELPEFKISSEKIEKIRQRLLDISEMSKRAYIEATKALIHALEVKDPLTLGHAGRTAHYSALVAKEMQLGEDEVRVIEHAGLLHDIGKICIPDEILLKPGAFTEEEYEEMKMHPILGYQIVKPIRFLSEEAMIILHHHEWFNGSGYPHRLRGREISIGARIVAALDAYDTMRAAGTRYKKTMTCVDAVHEMIVYSGTQFDPEVVYHVIQMLIHKNELSPRAYDYEQMKQRMKKTAA